MPTEQYSDYTTWLQFFKDAFILPEFSQNYAKKFCENRIRFDMLSDLDKQLLNELGITAVGDCLSILKHSRAILARLEQQNKEFDLSDSQAVNEVNQAKTRCQVVKRIIKTYLNDAPPNDGNTKTPIEKPPSNSILSSNLITRVGFSSNMNQSAMKPVVTFNEESLSNGKVLVSSTTNDEKVGSNLKSRSLKRKLNDDEIGDHKPLEYQGTLKDPIPNVSKTIIKLNKSSLNDHSVLISTNQNAVKTAAMDFSRQNSPNLRITKTIQINKKEAPSEVVPTRTAELSNLKVSVFKQIKNVNKTEILGKLAGTHEKSKIISLKKIKTSTTSAATISRLNSNQSANNYLKTSDIKSRLNFN